MPTKDKLPPRDWGKTGPNGEKPNLRLAAGATGYAYYRSGTVQYDLPTAHDGEPDEHLQRAGFWHAYAHRVQALAPGYLLVTDKGVKP